MGLDAVVRLPIRPCKITVSHPPRAKMPSRNSTVPQRPTSTVLQADRSRELLYTHHYMGYLKRIR